MNAATQFIHEQLTAKKQHPKFKAGDNVTVNYKIVEGGKERVQGFRGDVVKIQGTGATATLSGTGTGAAQSFTTYGSLSLNQFLTPDNYSDNLTVTLSY